MSGIDKQIELVQKIVKGKIKYNQVKTELENISKKYGDNCFNSYVVKKKNKPWDRKYLQELENLSASGAASKEFYLHMAEVSDHVYGKIKKIRIAICAIGALLTLTAIIVAASIAIKIIRHT